MHATPEKHMSPDEITAYLARTLPDEHRKHAELHFAICDACRGDLIAVSAEAERRKTKRWVTVSIPTVAAAAVAVLLLVPGARGPTPRLQAPAIRCEQVEGTRTFLTVAPANGAEVVRDSVVFGWRSEGADVGYRLTLTDEVGDVLWSESTSDTTLALPIK